MLSSSMDLLDLRTLRCHGYAILLLKVHSHPEVDRTCGI